MRLYLDDNKNWWDYVAGEAIEVDVAYHDSYAQTASSPELVSGVVHVGYGQDLTVTVGTGTKIHRASGMMVNIDDAGMNWHGNHWFGVSPRCQQYRGRGLNWVQVSQPRTVKLAAEGEIVTCSKCS